MTNILTFSERFLHSTELTWDNHLGNHSSNNLSNCEQILTENARITKWTPKPISVAVRILSMLWFTLMKITSGGITRIRAIDVLNQNDFIKSSGEISLWFLPEKTIRAG